MKFVDEYRDAESVKLYAQKIASTVTRPWRIMEICGGQTHSIVRFGVDQLLPKGVELIHGPGCPVCVTPLDILDKAIRIAAMEKVIFCSFGDMLRVPGSKKDLLSVKAEGGDVRIVYSPMDALDLALHHPEKEVVFFAVGFETTAPANAMAVYLAREKGIANFSVLVSQVLVPPALEMLLSSPDCNIDGILAAGHVCTVMGFNEYIPLSQKYRIPIVVTGFEPLDLLEGIHDCILQLQMGLYYVENSYARTVRRKGNEEAQAIVHEVFEVIPRKWRGLGEIPESGLGLRPAYAAFDAEKRFHIEETLSQESTLCLSGSILRGVKKPYECPLFGTTCTPEHPLGATMVSSEGTCAAYYEYRRVNGARK
jgi:hydrogenase expression/formation protein HypD